MIILKNVVFDIKNSNWGLIGPDSWREREWKIYDDITEEEAIGFGKSYLDMLLNGIKPQ